MVMRVLAIFAIGASAALVSPVLFADEYPQCSIDPDRAQNKVPIGHLDKAYPRSPDELFRCVDAGGEQVLSKGPVCARQIRTIYCVKAPCPQSEKWFPIRMRKRRAQHGTWWSTPAIAVVMR